MNIRRLSALYCLLVSMALAPFVAVNADTAKPASTIPPPLAIGTVAPDFTVQDPSGAPVHLSDYKGKVVVIDFWATWCGPCQAAMPHTNEIAKEFKGQNVVFLGISIDDTKEAFDGWLPKHKDYDAMSFLRDPSERKNNIAKTLYSTYFIPTQYVIDPAGKIAYCVGYGSPTSDLEVGIKNALKATPSS